MRTASASLPADVAGLRLRQSPAMVGTRTQKRPQEAVARSEFQLEEHGTAKLSVGPTAVAMGWIGKRIWAEAGQGATVVALDRTSPADRSEHVVAVAGDRCSRGRIAR